MKDNGNTLIFVHNPKTAGTTFISIADKNYPPSEIFTVSGLHINESIAAFKSLTEEKRNSFSLIIGHETIGLHKYLATNVRYVTYLRDPVEHFISLFFYIQRAVAHGHHKSVAKMKSINEFFDFAVKNKMDNMQTRNLADPQGVQPDVIEDLFALGKQHVEELIDYVFLSEEFDSSLVFFKKKLGWKRIAGLSQNVTANRPSIDTLDQETIERIKSVNKYDILLYEIARRKHVSLMDAVVVSSHDLKSLRRQRKKLQFVNITKKPIRKIYYFLKGIIS